MIKIKDEIFVEIKSLEDYKRFIAISSIALNLRWASGGSIKEYTPFFFLNRLHEKMYSNLKKILYIRIYTPYDNVCVWGETFYPPKNSCFYDINTFSKMVLYVTKKLSNLNDIKIKTTLLDEKLKRMDFKDFVARENLGFF